LIEFITNANGFTVPVRPGRFFYITPPADMPVERAKRHKVAKPKNILCD
jgi:hypothetical protein